MRQRLFVLLVSLLVAVLAVPVIASAQNGAPDDPAAPGSADSEESEPEEAELDAEDEGEHDAESHPEEEGEDDQVEDDQGEHDATDDEDDDEGNGNGRVAVDRVFGPDRFSTSVAISQYEFPGGASEVYLARADNFADAVSAGALKKGPVLLVPQCGDLPAVVAAELARLHPRKVVALGGPGAVCDDILLAAADAANDGRGHSGTAGEPVGDL